MCPIVTSKYIANAKSHRSDRICIVHKKSKLATSYLQRENETMWHYFESVYNASFNCTFFHSLPTQQRLLRPFSANKYSVTSVNSFDIDQWQPQLQKNCIVTWRILIWLQQSDEQDVGPPNLLLNAFTDHIWLTEIAEHSMC